MLPITARARSTRSAAIASPALVLAGVLAVALLPSPARAHGGNPAVALLLTPPIEGASTTSTYAIQWLDSNQMIPTGTATVNLFFTSRMPPTFTPGIVPASLEGTPIIQNVPEADITDQYDWDTTSVAAGNYFIWSAVNEPAVEMSLKIISFAPGILEVMKPSVPRKPWVVISKPDSPFRFADQEYTIEYRSSDPNGTARVRLEATQNQSGEGLMVIADDLPALATGTFAWNTGALLEGDWLIRATITDASGESFTAWSRYFLFVHRLDSLGDAGVIIGRDSGQGDAGTGADPDGGVNPDASTKLPARKSGGCSCTASGADRPTPRHLALLVAIMLVVTRRSRRRRAP